MPMATAPPVCLGAAFVVISVPFVDLAVGFSVGPSVEDELFGGAGKETGGGEDAAGTEEGDGTVDCGGTAEEGVEGGDWE